MKRWLVILIPLVVILGLVGWRISQKRADAVAQDKQRESRKNAALLVDVAKTTRANIVRTFDAVGTLEATLSVDVTPKISGPVTYLNVREGDRVTQGQVLAQIDPSEAQATVRNREAAVAQAQARLAEAQAAQGANNTGLSSEVNRQRALVTTAQAQAAQASADAGTLVAAAQAQVADAAGQISAAQSAIAAADAAITTAQATLANTRTQQARQESLYKDGATAKELLDNARTATLVAEGAVKQAQQQRESAQATLKSAQAQQKAALEAVKVAQNKARADVAVSRAAIRQNQAALQSAQANTGRQEAYTRNLQALTAAVTAAQADLRSVQAQLGDATLRSPLDGVVTRRYRDPGSLASPSAPVVAVASVSRLWATIPAPEEVTRRLSVGQTASVALDTFAGRTFAGRIVRIDPGADPSSRQFIVRVALDNSQGLLRPGTFARVTMVTERADNVLTIPQEAITQGKDGPQVTVVAGDVAQTRAIKTGLSDSKKIAVTSGLQEGDSVITVAGRAIKDGQKVKVGDDNAAPASGGGSGNRPRTQQGQETTK